MYNKNGKKKKHKKHNQGQKGDLTQFSVFIYA